MTFYNEQYNDTENNKRIGNQPWLSSELKPSEEGRKGQHF